MPTLAEIIITKTPIPQPVQKSFTKTNSNDSIIPVLCTGPISHCESTQLFMIFTGIRLFFQSLWCLCLSSRFPANPNSKNILTSAMPIAMRGYPLRIFLVRSNLLPCRSTSGARRGSTASVATQDHTDIFNPNDIPGL